MNALDFFSLSDFVKLRDIYQNQIVVRLTDTPFSKTVKVNGNEYWFAISTGYYDSSFCNGAYHITGFYDFNHICNYRSDRRDIYGGTMTPDMESYASFLDSINAYFSDVPDYEVAQFLQLTFF